MSEQAAMMSTAAAEVAESGPMMMETAMTHSKASPKLDLTLYLVTSSSLLPSNTTLEAHIESAIKGGVTIVQLREKSLDTAPFIALGKRIHAITQKYGVPLLINDRVDVALAVGCEGAHIGWDDMDYNTARKLLGPSAIIGLSVSNMTQASLAASTSANYLGIGPIFPTRTKPDASAPLYPSGLRQILESISEIRPDLPSVAIGSINASNLQAVLYKSRPSSGMPLAGVAVVSAIISSSEPEAAASNLLSLYKSPPPWSTPPPSQQTGFNDFYRPLVLSRVVSTIQALKQHKPLVHHITNAVVKNISANVTLAVGGSPIMSDNTEEVADLANISPYSACLVNMGTSGPLERRLYAHAIKENNKAGKPVVFDPVGGGATGMRRETVKWVLEECGYVDVIKGNEGEIRTEAGEGVSMKGVDSDTKGEVEEFVTLVKGLARRERNVVVATGATDVLSDGTRTVLVRNGHPFQSAITGIGCALGSVICAAVAVEKDDKLMSCLAGILLYNIAAERAASREEVRGPGSFLTAFLDEIYVIGQFSYNGDGTWLDGINVEFR